MVNHSLIWRTYLNRWFPIERNWKVSRSLADFSISMTHEVDSFDRFYSVWNRFQIGENIVRLQLSLKRIIREILLRFVDLIEKTNENLKRYFYDSTDLNEIELHISNVNSWLSTYDIILKISNPRDGRMADLTRCSEVRGVVSGKLRAFVKQTTYWPPERTRRGLCSSVKRCLELRGIVVNSSMDKFQDDVEGVCSEGPPQDLYAAFLPYAYGRTMGLWCFQVTTVTRVERRLFLYSLCSYYHLGTAESFQPAGCDW